MVPPGAVLNNEPSGLQGNSGVRPDLNAGFDYPGRVAEYLLDVPVAHAQGCGLVRGRVPQLRGIFFDRLASLQDDRQLLVLHFDELGGVLSEIGLLGQHDGDGFSNVTYPVSCQHGLQEVVELVLGARTYRDGFYPGEVLPGQHLLDSGKGERGLGLNLHDLGVSVSRSEHPHPQLSRAVDVVDEMPEAAQQAPVFEAPDPAPDRAHWPWSPASRRGDTLAI